MTWDFTYTDGGYLDQVTNPDGEVTKHEYLSDGRLKKITLRATELSNKATRELFYEDTDNNHAYVSGKMPYLRRTLDKKESGTVIADFEYELDKAGVRLSMKDKDGKYWAYGYDPRYQLRSETKWSQKVNGSRQYQYGWLYDANGNRLTQHHDGVPTDYVYGGNNEMLEAGSVEFTYDHFGNTKTKVEGGNTTTYHWDDEGHLLGVDYPGTTNDDSHEYDGDGRRMRSKLAGAANWTEFVHDELTGEILIEYTLVSGTFTVKAVNTWGLGLISANREGTKRYFHFDGLGSTRALTDSSGNVTDTYEYNAFGVLESSTGTSVNPFRYVGQWGYYDDGAMGSSSGLLLLGVRYYSPAHGRFWSWDPVPNLNLYAYANNSATMAIDPSGAKVRYCYRGIYGFPDEEGWSHPYLITDACGTIGLTGRVYGVCVSQVDDPVRGAGWCQRINEGEGKQHCRDLNLSAEEEACVCRMAKNARKGWVLCGNTWRAEDYNWWSHNSQHFIIALLMKCTGKDPGLPWIGNRPFDLEDCFAPTRGGGGGTSW
jgi:RHS repeat-associated protein